MLIENKRSDIFYKHGEGSINGNITSMLTCGRYYKDIEKLVYIDLILAGGEDRRNSILSQIHGKNKETISRAISTLTEVGLIQLNSRASKHDESSRTSYGVLGIDY